MDALLLIDFQKDFLVQGGRMQISPEQAEPLIAIANKLIDYFQETGGKAIFIGNEFSKTDFMGNLFRRFCALKGSDGALLDPRMHSDGRPYFPKVKSDAFSNPDLDPYLKKLGVGRIYVSGVYSEGCVRATAIGAEKAGYQVFVVADGVASNRGFKHEWALSYLRRRGVTVLHSSQLFITP